MKVALSRMHFPVTTLGPGKRIGIWFQGCSIKCVGCVSKDTWPAGINQVPIEDVYSVLSTWLPHADGVTISGGEPFDQFDQLKHILSFIRQHSAGAILVYSGYGYDALADRLTVLDPLIDALISEPFDSNQPQTLPLRGSDNQQLHLLTAQAKEAFANPDQETDMANQLDASMVNDEIWLAGIAEQDLMHRLASELADKGYDVEHSQTRLLRHKPCS